MGTLLTHWFITVPAAGCLVLAAALLWAISRGHLLVLQPLLPTERDRKRMLGRLRLRYEQMLAQSLQGAVQVELGLLSRPAAVQQAASLALRLPGQPDFPLPAHTSIVQAYELAQHEVLILGEPGAGKSTLLLELAHHLTAQAEQDSTQPLPVLLPLSSWVADRRPLQNWLAEQVASLYDVPRRLSRQGVEGKQFLPLLDGLDEIEEPARSACIQVINTSHREHLGPLVVCSRTAEYNTAARGERLALHTAVVVQPLSYAQVDAHLATLGKPLAGLLRALRKNPSLQAVVTTPLLLLILLLTYRDMSVRALSQTKAQVHQQIWKDYIEHMTSRKGDTRRYSLQTTTIWLAWLAREMLKHNQTIFLLEQLQPDWLPARHNTVCRWSLRLFGLLAVLLAVLLDGLLVGLLAGWLVGLFGALFIGLFFGLLFWFKKTQLVEVLTWSWKNARQGLLIGLVVGLPLGLAAAIQHYTVCFWLWRMHVFPLNADAFLEDATRRVLLRRVGGGSSFAHRLLLEYFADLDAKGPLAPTTQQMKTGVQSRRKHDTGQTAVTTNADKSLL